MINLVSEWLALPARPLTDVYLVSEDAGFILDGGDPEGDEWFYAEVPEGMLPDTTGPLVEEAERNGSIVEWVLGTHSGDWLSALRESPLLVLIQVPKKIYLVDGWHRLKLARISGLKVIPVCFAFETR